MTTIRAREIFALLGSVFLLAVLSAQAEPQPPARPGASDADAELDRHQHEERLEYDFFNC